MPPKMGQGATRVCVCVWCVCVCCIRTVMSLPSFIALVMCAESLWPALTAARSIEPRERWT